MKDNEYNTNNLNRQNQIRKRWLKYNEYLRQKELQKEYAEIYGPDLAEIGPVDDDDPNG